MNVDIEKTLSFLRSLVIQKTRQPLTPVEEQILRQCWESKTYDEMETAFSGYTIDTVKKQLAPKLWKRLSTATQQKVTKKNIKIVLEPLIKENKKDEFKSQIIRSRYEITQILSSGCLSKIYLAQDLDLNNQPCVVKQMLRHSNEKATKKFSTEVGYLYQLGCHPQIARLLDHYEDEEGYYLVYKFVEGEVLSQKLPEDSKSDPWFEESVIELLLNILKVLDFVHKRGVIHRDIKPSNLIQTLDGKIVLINFGSVKVEMIGQKRTFTGTPGYMAPEQSSGTPRLNSDIYAVGMVAIQALTGTPPRDFQVDYETGAIVWRKSVKISQEFAVILDKMAHPQFKNRYPSGGEALRDLKQLFSQRLE